MTDRRGTSKYATTIARSIAICLSLALLAVPACSQSEHASSPEPTGVATVAPAAPRLDRVAVIGASASGGFGAVMITEGPDREYRDQVRLGPIIEAALGPGSHVFDEADAFMFLAPRTSGSRSVRRVVDREASLVVAVDFLFWFAYGSLDVAGRAIDHEDDRLELLEFGLALLDQIKTPIILGDIPDVSAARGGMLHRDQIPAADTHDRLNTRIREWVDTRQNVVLVPLSQFVRDATSGTIIELANWTWDPAEQQLMQEDRLHPTPTGLVALAQLVLSAMIDLGAATWSDFDADPDTILQRLARRFISERTGE